MAIPAISGTSPVNIHKAKKDALALINAFHKSKITTSSYYPKLSKSNIVTQLKNTINGNIYVLDQGNASLCGPAAFFYSLSKVRPDIYVQLVTDLYTNGQAKLKNLELKSSPEARQLKPARIQDADWLILTSIKPKYDNPSEKIDGITLPHTLKDWFLKAGFGTAVDNTNLVNRKGIDTLLQAQNDYQSGHTICLLVDQDVFAPIRFKGRSVFANHWVVLTSDINIRRYDDKTKSLKKKSAIITPLMVKDIKDEIKSKKDLDIPFLNDGISKPVEIDDRILLDVFTWGITHHHVISKHGKSTEARLQYFLSGFFGYIKVKR